LASAAASSAETPRGSPFGPFCASTPLPKLIAARSLPVGAKSFSTKSFSTKSFSTKSFSAKSFSARSFTTAGAGALCARAGNAAEASITTAQTNERMVSSHCGGALLVDF
jgi:hypothetical protein